MEKVAKDLEYNMTFIRTDMCDTIAVDSMVAQVTNTFSKIDIHVNNAGYSDGKGVEVQTEGE